MEQWATLIGQLGFPIFTAIFFMTKLQASNEKTNEILTKLTILIEKLEGTKID